MKKTILITLCFSFIFTIGSFSAYSNIPDISKAIRNPFGYAPEPNYSYELGKRSSSLQSLMLFTVHYYNTIKENPIDIDNFIDGFNTCHNCKITKPPSKKLEKQITQFRKATLQLANDIINSISCMENDTCPPYTETWFLQKQRSLYTIVTDLLNEANCGETLKDAKYSWQLNTAEINQLKSIATNNQNSN